MTNMKVHLCSDIETGSYFAFRCDHTIQVNPTTYDQLDNIIYAAVAAGTPVLILPEAEQNEEGDAAND